ncbi:DUF2306 domain-containing protein [Chachezhania antarctica]|uniref:DUF2306 domain-containing protein n=1 Tax=Chachezhania antarctica TaxID=2340860 RepID=UPI0013CF1391|nr:DUF2306 domain-containing protein [Chachezhania antarctica]|tara:strand:+ start:4114 stop:4773 length:660 start_codon:yes stop_codon:yes gene_type:complete
MHPTSLPTPQRLLESRPLFRVAAVLSVLVALVSFRFIPLGIETAFPVLEVNPDAGKTLLMTHVLSASATLVLALPQFLPWLRARHPGLHRWTGRLYALAILIAGLSGLGMAITAFDARPVAGVGFGVLAILWLAVTARGIWLARRGEIARHRPWMIRSFALTLAAVSLRLQLQVMLGLGMDYDAASNILGWSCWVPNLIVAEWLLRGGARARQGIATAV